MAAEVMAYIYFETRAAMDQWKSEHPECKINHAIPVARSLKLSKASKDKLDKINKLIPLAAGQATRKCRKMSFESSEKRNVMWSASYHFYMDTMAKEEGLRV